MLECETKVVSGLTAYGPGYIKEERKDLGADRRAADRQTAEACVHAVWRNQDGDGGSQRHMAMRSIRS